MGGLFITFEGMEGSGKSTQLKLLADDLETKGYPVVRTREPGGTMVGDAIRAILLDEHNQMSAETELFLYQASRAQHVAEIIVPALREGRVVLCDRFIDATLAYQGYGRGLELAYLNELNEMAIGDLRPHLTLLFDCPVGVGLARARSRNVYVKGPDEGRFEAEEDVFHQRVRDGYLELAATNTQRFRILDATSSIEALQQQVMQEVESKLS